MKQERRENERKHIQCSVVLCCGHLGLISGQASNINAEGMYVRTGRVTLNVNARVEVCFGVGGRERRRFHRIAARVVRIEKSGMGLQFVKEQRSFGGWMEDLAAESVERVN